MTIAVDLGRKANKQTNKWDFVVIVIIIIIIIILMDVSWVEPILVRMQCLR